ncbi:uncharacterized protein K452DRAFT_7512 [Aplosporella prunicola CBS 121167]|uniref:Uncharacterized protein n=1 Tax=Aplosporella prunicola CBS 121167 TaxID=1176127 RepID=A0A6A6BX12_9PEZI|nr:uncharacterized protein K452DRAFT_7512 [Aplosporella prunicola CBS 121167]KAF2147447.1 hypothetical protein K452DRAFT_7512 [Aplosporella prunicola CBS 121167]
MDYDCFTEQQEALRKTWGWRIFLEVTSMLLFCPLITQRQLAPAACSERLCACRALGLGHTASTSFWSAEKDPVTTWPDHLQLLMRHAPRASIRLCRIALHCIYYDFLKKNGRRLEKRLPFVIRMDFFTFYTFMYNSPHLSLLTSHICFLTAYIFASLHRSRRF